LGNTAKAEETERQYQVMSDDMLQLGRALEHASVAGRDPQLLSRIGLLYYRLGSYTEAIQWLNAALRANPDDKICHQALADCYSHFPDPESQKQAENHRRRAEKQFGD